MGTSTLNQKTSGEKARKWVYAKKPSGPLLKKRQFVGYSLIAFLFIAPFLRIDGEPFLMFNIIERKFVIFGNIFWPEDLYVFVFGMLIILVCIVLFTAVYGRVWCGWTCPQTVFMELIFRPIEYLIEGDRTQQMRVARQPKTWKVRQKKILKYSIFYLISFFIANIFLAYIIGTDELLKIISEPPSEHIVGLLSILIFSFVFFFVFAYVRDIVCTHICPYGRLQGVLVDDNSSVIAYNYNRGEPRGKKSRKEIDELGDCIDCNLCVHVCPTGIDIRDGLQLECVSCTNCIDACDEVMIKLDRPTRLIGFYTTEELKDNKKKKGNTRAVVYTSFLFVLVSIFAFLIFSRSDVSGTLLRATGSTYQTRDDGTITNLYSLQLINKTNKQMEVELVPENPEYGIQVVNPKLNLGRGEASEMNFFLILPKEKIETYKTKVKVNVVYEDKVIETLNTTFIGPVTN
ncbi:MAG TPA: cytochrome c oxidase accessory protein CcoG [Candidatus Sphingobacterium stercoripullorum]|uniref:Cytochrome c oxidase accessory protein CcoG n=1 Tax=Candidatus Sphingobacterium stercoripullorum TaxID=2838759 RepID=A0A9D1W7G1_9SPHI|nr:cytochrome c oxidase accessory protein CcoG [Candidatus Sphingobacterium stercoripullorum]HLR48985.1 cytochrome c oxidase accessory protein CcoG [Candidatus Sphingobacterium stercoripullorum]